MQAMKLPIPNPEDWMDVAAATEMLGCSRAHVYNLDKQEVLKLHSIGRVRLLWRAEVEAVASAKKRLGYRGRNG